MTTLLEAAGILPDMPKPHPTLPGYPAAWGPGGEASGEYRYVLWSPGAHEGAPYLCMVGLNPSTATTKRTDPTFRWAMRLADSVGCTGGLCMVNVCALRSPRPEVLRSHLDPVGPENVEWLVRCARAARYTVAAWGNGGGGWGRQSEAALRAAGVELWCLGTTLSGEPYHPRHFFYQHATPTLQPFCRGI